MTATAPRTTRLRVGATALAALEPMREGGARDP